MIRYLLLPLCVLLLFGCEQQNTEVPTLEAKPQTVRTDAASEAKVDPVTLLKTSLTAKLYETPSEALFTWRKYRSAKPKLVILANDPFLREIPPELWEQSTDLVLHGSQQELISKASRPSSNPLFFPQMAIMAALQADLVSEVIWVVPVKPEQNTLDLAAFRSQLIDYGALYPDQAEDLQQAGNSIQGIIYDHPFRAVTLNNLPKLDGPILLHFDLSFFSPLYRQEVGTPLYPLVFKTLYSLRDTAWKALEVTISSSNLVGGMPLDTRFLGRNLQTLFAKPGQLDQSIPHQWQLRAEALYLENFFKKDEVREKYLAMQEVEPQNPAVKYALFQVERQRRDNVQAMKFLAEAVALEPTYAQAYLDLVPIALDANRPDAALQMLDKAIGNFPDNPFIPLKKAEILSKMGHLPQLEAILSAAEKFTWSATYYPDIQKYFSSMITQAKQASETTQTSETPAPKNTKPKSNRQ